MQQIINITQARNNLSKIVSSVASKRKKVVIVRDSLPEVVLIPYRDYLVGEEKKEKMWKLRFEQLLKKGKKEFKKWAKKKKINLKKLSEEKVYEIIDKA